ncbi:hypothetical protein PAMP_000612 [Pampus punctatissimus]
MPVVASLSTQGGPDIPTIYTEDDSHGPTCCSDELKEEKQTRRKRFFLKADLPNDADTLPPCHLSLGMPNKVFYMHTQLAEIRQRDENQHFPCSEAIHQANEEENRSGGGEEGELEKVTFGDGAGSRRKAVALYSPSLIGDDGPALSSQPSPLRWLSPMLLPDRPPETQQYLTPRVGLTKHLPLSFSSQSERGAPC